MATRSFIGKVQQDGSIHGIYCHYDGYPEGVGATLKEHYQNPQKVDALLALGDISSLGSELGEKHRFESPTPGWTVAYHRDRGEELSPPMVYADAEQLVKNSFSDVGAEWAYVFHHDGWRTYETTP